MSASTRAKIHGAKRLLAIDTTGATDEPMAGWMWNAMAVQPCLPAAAVVAAAGGRLRPRPTSSPLPPPRLLPRNCR